MDKYVKNFSQGNLSQKIARPRYSLSTHALRKMRLFCNIVGGIMCKGFAASLAKFSLVLGMTTLPIAIAQPAKQNMKEDSKATHHRMHQSMETMHKDMMAMPAKGDTDQDFVSMMIRHHQGAIDMAQIEIENGKDEKVKAFARKTIEMQKKDIAELEGMKTKPESKASR